MPQERAKTDGRTLNNPNELLERTGTAITTMRDNLLIGWMALRVFRTP